MDVVRSAGARSGYRGPAAIALGVLVLAIGAGFGPGATGARAASSHRSNPRLVHRGKPACGSRRRTAHDRAARHAPCRETTRDKATRKPAPKRKRRATPKPGPKKPAPKPSSGGAPNTPAPIPPQALTPPTTPNQPAGASAWDEPALVNPTVITLSDANRSVTLNQSKDYIVECPPGQFDVSGKITIWGGHNVVFQDCDEDMTNPSGDWAGYLEDQTGTLWVHDVHFGGGHLTGGIQLQEPGATVVMRDVLFDTVNGSYATNHAECIQSWSGPARFLIDGLQCTTTYQGLFLLPNQWDSTTLETTWDFRNMQIDGDGAYDLWLGNVQPSQLGQLSLFNVENVYDCGSGEPRDWDGTSDAGQAWASVKSCPATGVPHPVWANPDGGVTGDDDGSEPLAIAGEQP